MYRYRRRRKLDRRRRRALSAVALSAVLALAVGIPTLAAGDQVNDTLNNVGLGSGSGGSSGGASTNAGVPGVGAGYVPPLHGDNPHGQGTNAIIDLQPENANPYPGTPDGSEELIVGDSRGEQNGDGTYHGSVALAYLFGNAILGIQSNPGDGQVDGPFQPLQDGLNQLCGPDGSNGGICLNVLEEHSFSDGSGSNNSFHGLGVHLGDSAPGANDGLDVDLLRSHGSISQDQNGCQTAHGDSNVAEVNAGGNPVLDAFEANSTSDCSGANTQSSKVIELGGNGVPFPADGCADGTPNTTTEPNPLLVAVCNATDVGSGGQFDGVYGVREALTLFALISGDSALLKVTAGKAESAVKRASTTPPTTPTTPSGGTKGAGGKGGKGGGGGAGEGAGGGAGAAAGQAAAGGGNLAFTGADLLALAMVGGALILGGLALTTTAGRRHRQTV